MPDTPPRPERKTSVASRQNAASRKARDRLAKMLEGAHKLGTARHFRGPLDYTVLQGMVQQFDGVIETVGTETKDGTRARELLAKLLQQAGDVVEQVQEAADLYHPHGTPGRAVFFVPGGGQKAVEDELAACIDGLKADAKGENLLTGLPGTDLLQAEELLKDLHRARKAAEKHEALVEDAQVTRASVGQKIRQVSPNVERLVRLLHKNDAVALQKYGLKPRGNQGRVTTRARKKSVTAGSAAKGKATAGGKVDPAAEGPVG